MLYANLIFFACAFILQYQTRLDTTIDLVSFLILAHTIPPPQRLRLHNEIKFSSKSSNLSVPEGLTVAESRITMASANSE